MAVPRVREIWMLWNTENERWLIAADDPDPYDAYLCYFSEEAAIAGQKHQRELYEVKTVPIQVR